MVPHIAARGHSFKGAGLYYLHDKEAMTSERVAWTYTHNLPTNDPEKGLKWMAHTSKNADYLKNQAGVSKSGRKSTAGHVYGFSLSWHPEQNPDQEQMKNAALETLELLGLKDHEAVIVAHQETEHPHVHIIANLINPNDGRVAVPSYDFLKLSTWAEEQEKKEGKIYCEERVQNNEKRRELAEEFIKEDRRKRQQEYKKEKEQTGVEPPEKPESGIVRHKEKKMEVALQIQELYSQSDSGKAFNAALNEAGYTLAKGERRGFVLVDEAGEIYSLSRQLKGQRAKDIKNRLADIDQEKLPQGREISYERKHFDRDQYEIERQKAIVDAAITEDETQKKDGRKSKEQSDQEKRDIAGEKKRMEYDESHLIALDRLRAWEQSVDRKRYRLEEELSKAYNVREIEAKLEDLRKEISRKQNSVIARMTGRMDALKEEQDALAKTKANIEMRMQERRDALEAEIERSRPEDLNRKTDQSPEPEKDQKLKEWEAKQYDDLQRQRDRDHDHDLGY